MPSSARSMARGDIVERFVSFVAEGRLAHAYLFTGPRFIGKTLTAIAVAKVINGECLLEDIQQGLPDDFMDSVLSQHMDIHLLSSPDYKTIKLESVQEMLAQIRLRPFRAKVKVFVVKNAETLTPEAANSLLKTLEEPAEHSLLILTAAVVDKVLPTIRSRCHEIAFTTQPPRLVAEVLNNQFPASEEENWFLSCFSGGGVIKALELRDQGVFERKNELLDLFFHESADGDFIKTLSADKSETGFFLEVLLSWIRDAVMLKSGQADSSLIHRDRFAEIDHFQKMTGWNDLWKVYRQVTRARRDLEENFNIRIPLMIIKEQFYGKHGGNTAGRISSGLSV
jgi:DNA polymerase III subunit delta'